MDPTTLENLIVREIRKAKDISRKDLAERLGIAKSTAGRRIDSMIERGIVTWEAVPDSLRELWEEPHGDRRQELVFIGLNLDPEAIEDALFGANTEPA